MSGEDIFDKLFIFEMANNHMGDVDHGISIIREFGKIIKGFPEFSFGFKFQLTTKSGVSQENIGVGNWG